MIWKVISDKFYYIVAAMFALVGFAQIIESSPMANVIRIIILSVVSVLSVAVVKEMKGD